MYFNLKIIFLKISELSGRWGQIYMYVYTDYTIVIYKWFQTSTNFNIAHITLYECLTFFMENFVRQCWIRVYQNSCSFYRLFHILLGRIFYSVPNLYDLWFYILLNKFIEIYWANSRKWINKNCFFFFTSIENIRLIYFVIKCTVHFDLWLYEWILTVPVRFSKTWPQVN